MNDGRDTPRFRVLILGGSGVFGSRIARLLASDPRFDILIGARRIERAERVAHELSQPEGANLTACQIDRDSGFADALASLKPDLVVHAAGPFRGQDYGVARACLAAGTHYLDLADDRSFVEQFERLDPIAKSRACIALTGLSSVPALSSAAVRALADGMAHIAEIRIGITPGNRAPRGRAVIESVLAGVGQPSEQRKGGAWLSVRGWQDLHRRTLKAGHRKLKRWFAHCEVPDPDSLLARYPTAETITFHAGLELGVLHLGLWLLSWLVRWRLVRNLQTFARPLGWIADLLRPFGSDVGGMFVELTGRDAQKKWLRRSWTLIAGSGDGPMVPAIPAALMVREIAAGHAPRPGARAALMALPLKSLEEAMSSLDVTIERTETPLDLPLFPRILGDDFAALPPPVRDLHLGLVTLRFEGEARVIRGAGLITQLLGALLGLPEAAENLPVTVMIEPRKDGERWSRAFGKQGFVSRFVAGKRAGMPWLIERFGPFGFEMALEADKRRLTMRCARASFLGLTWPAFLAPRVSAEERMENTRFVFDVRVELPLFGLLVHYVGWLVPLSVSLRPQAMRRMEVSATVEARSPTWPY